MHVPLCMCGLMPRIDHTTRVVLLVHPAEWDRPSNTGRVAVLALKRAELATWSPSLDPELLFRDGHDTLLLHPAGKPLVASDRPISLIVPDGTWRESSRIARRLAELPRVQRVRLDSPPRAGLREAPSPDRLGTADAIADALARLGEHDAARALRDVLRIMKDRSLWTRGKLGAERVAGGIPLAVRRAMSGGPPG